MDSPSKQEITKLVAETIDIPVEKLKPEADFFADLDIDSMVALEIVASVEKKYKITIPEEEVPKIRCLKDIFELLNRLYK